MINYLDIQVTEPAAPEEPVTLPEAKQWAVIDHADDDLMVTSMITGARQDIENATGLFLVPKAVVAYVESTSDNDIIRLPHGTAASIVVKRVGNQEELTDLTAGTDYYTRAAQYVLPNAPGTFQIGYTAGEQVPQALKEAVKMLVAYRYKYRSDQDKDKQQGLPEDVTKKIEKYVQIWL